MVPVGRFELPNAEVWARQVCQLPSHGHDGTGERNRTSIHGLRVRCSTVELRLHNGVSGEFRSRSGWVTANRAPITLRPPWLSEPESNRHCVSAYLASNEGVTPMTVAQYGGRGRS